MTWSVMDDNGVASSEGLTEERAIALAQARADETGRTWTAYDASAGEGGESVECEPAVATKERVTAEDVAAKHGCEIQPGAFGRAALVVQPRHQQGHPQDARRLRACLDDLRAAGLRDDFLV